MIGIWSVHLLGCCSLIMPTGPNGWWDLILPPLNSPPASLLLAFSFLVRIFFFFFEIEYCSRFLGSGLFWSGCLSLWSLVFVAPVSLILWYQTDRCLHGYSYLHKTKKQCLPFKDSLHLRNNQSWFVTPNQDLERLILSKFPLCFSFW